MPLADLPPSSPTNINTASMIIPEKNYNLKQKTFSRPGSVEVGAVIRGGWGGSSAAFPVTGRTCATRGRKSFMHNNLIVPAADFDFWALPGRMQSSRSRCPRAPRWRNWLREYINRGPNAIPSLLSILEAGPAGVIVSAVRRLPHVWVSSFPYRSIVPYPLDLLTSLNGFHLFTVPVDRPR